MDDIEEARMARNLLELVDLLRDELQEFYRVLRRGEGDLEAVAARLRRTLSHVEPYAHHTENWREFVSEQRWGYVQLVSLVETVRSELRRNSFTA